MQRSIVAQLHATQRNIAANFMLYDLVDVYEIKRKLVEQSVQRLLDVHLGKYVPEDGEIVGLWEPAALEVVALRIARYNVDKMKITTNDEEEKEIEEEERQEKEEKTLYIYDFEGTGEQLRRLRAYNPILADETEDEYNSRIWYIADKEDEEEENKRVNEEE